MIFKILHKHRKLLTVLVLGVSVLIYLHTSSYLITTDMVRYNHFDVFETLKNVLEVSDDRKLMDRDTLQATEAPFYEPDERVIVEEFGWRKKSGKEKIGIEHRSYHLSSSKRVHRGKNSKSRGKIDEVDAMRARALEQQLLSQQVYAKQIHTAATREGEKAYTIANRESCKSRKDLIIWIYSAPGNKARRDQIRRTWMSDSFSPLNVVIIFGLARVTNDTQQEWIHLESQEFSDIVQDGSFVDSYFNLSMKGLSMLRWVNQFCNGSMLLKTDDDTYIIPTRLVHWYNYLRRTSKGIPKRTIYGVIWMKSGPHRNLNSKWYTSYQVWPNKYYSFLACPGEGYFITTDSIPLLLEQVSKTRFIWLEDMYITGVLAEHAHIYRSGMIDYYLPGSFTSYGGAKNVYAALHSDRILFLVPHVPTLFQMDSLHEYVRGLAQQPKYQPKRIIDLPKLNMTKHVNVSGTKMRSPWASSRMQNFINGMKLEKKNRVVN